MKAFEMVETLNALRHAIDLNDDQPAFTAQASRTHAMMAHEGKVWNEMTNEQRAAIHDQELEGLNVIPIKTAPNYFHPESYEALKRVIPALEKPKTAMAALLETTKDKDS